MTSTKNSKSRSVDGFNARLELPGMKLQNIIDADRFDLSDGDFRRSCRETLDQDGCLLLEGFLRSGSVQSVCEEAINNQHLAYYCVQEHNVYLTPEDDEFPTDHPRNRKISSSKGCITDDQVPDGSVLRSLYDASEFREFLCAVLGEKVLHEYADPLSSINIHYATEGQELGWHFDNSSFAITLLLQSPDLGGEFQYVRDLRYAPDGELNYDGVRQVLDDGRESQQLDIEPGTLVLFRGGNSMHRVTPVRGQKTRMLAVLAYNAEPGVELSESARMTFFGRLGTETGQRA